MSSSTISIFGNKIFLEILTEMKIFSEYKIKYYDEIDLCIKDAEEKDQLIIFFVNESNTSFLKKAQKNTFPLIFIGKPSFLKGLSSEKFYNQLTTPFTILDFKKKVIIAIAKDIYRKNSLIHLNDYIIDRNERKIKKNNLELQLSEKEVNFLILFKKKGVPINKNFVLKNVWNYSSESETHTVETHIHRLRKKILNKFGDNNFIKNNKKGYYI